MKLHLGKAAPLFVILLLVLVGGISFIQWKTRPQIRESKNWSAKSNISIGFIGDSLATDMVRTHNNLKDALTLIRSSQQNLVLGDYRAIGEAISLFEKLERKVPVRIANFSRPGADVFVRAAVRDQNALVRWLLNIPNMETEVDRLLDREFPNIVVVWTGQMEPLDWNDLRSTRDKGELTEFNKSNFASEADRDEGLRKWVDQKFSSIYEAQLRKVLERARKFGRPFTLLIYGLYNWKNLHDITEEIMRMKREGHQGFTEVRERTGYEGSLALYEKLNRSIQGIAEKLREEMPERIRVIYSSKLTTIEMNTADIENDGMHPSLSGKRKFAEVIANDLAPEIDRIKSVKNAK